MLKRFFSRIILLVSTSIVMLGIALLVIYLALPDFQQTPDPKIKDNTILELSFKDELVDYGGIFQVKMVTYQAHQGLVQVLKNIEQAMADDRIKGISLNLDHSKLGLAHIHEIRNKIAKFKTTGKFVYAYATNYSQNAYYLASVADSIFIHPHGALSFKGLASEVLYFKDFQDQFGIDLEVIQEGNFKGAAESFAKDEMSEHMRQHVQGLLKSLWQNTTQHISQARGLSSRSLNKAAAKGLVRKPDQALVQKFVDKLAYWDQYEAFLKAKIGADTTQSIDYVKSQDFSLAITKSPEQFSEAGDTNLIAVIFAQGYIVDQGDSPETISPELLRRSFEAVRQNDRIKAVILRINSPGGSALASEEIWREINITNKTKPVIASLGNMAASGGYYIAAAAEKIFSQPSTITGSIGVFAVLPSIQKIAEEKGINSSQVALWERSKSYSPFKQLTPLQKQDLKEDIHDTYSLFLKRVSEGRNIPVDKLTSVAEGRVWSGRQALARGLIDTLGGLEDAIAYAIKHYNVEGHKLMFLPIYKVQPLEFASNLFSVESLLQSKQDTWFKQLLGNKAHAVYERINVLLENKGPQAMSSFELFID